MDESHLKKTAHRISCNVIHVDGIKYGNVATINNRCNNVVTIDKLLNASSLG